MKKISVVVPAYNESKNLSHLIDEIEKISKGNYLIKIDEAVTTEINSTAYEWEYIFVNDGSTDSTLDVLAELKQQNDRVNYVNLSRNFGKENALLAGMDFASGDAIIIMDADLQDPVSIIPEMIYWWEQGYDDVYGKRKTRGKESWIRKRLSLAFYSILQGISSIEILENVGDFRLLDRRVVKAISSLRETQRYTKGLFCWVGYNKKEVVFDRADRAEGKSSFNFFRLFNLAIEGITCFTTAPLRISTIFGFIVSVMSLIYMLYFFIKTIFWGEAIRGFPTIICTILLIGGIQLIAIGIIGEYISRIFNETKGRPVYIVESFNGVKQ